MSIKNEPEDFIVEERLTPAWTACLKKHSGAFVLYQLRKRNLTTPEATGQLAKKLGVAEKQVLAAGLKDRSALTAQHVSVRWPTGGEKPPHRVDDDLGHWSAERVGCCDEPLSAQAIQANKFTLTLRELDHGDMRKINAGAARFAIDAQADRDAPRRLLITNYFGNQRFGSSRSGAGFIGAFLVRGDYEQALRVMLTAVHRKDHRDEKYFKQTCEKKWGRWNDLVPLLPRGPMRRPVEHLARVPGDFCGAFAAMPDFEQQIAAEAYQSWLWNRTAADLLCEQIPESALLVRKDRHHDAVFAERAAVPEDFLELNMPVLGADSVLREPWRAAAEKVLAQENLKTSDLCLPHLAWPKFSEIPRRLFMVAEQFRIHPPEPEGRNGKKKLFSLRLEFSLPRSGYATVLLRALGQ